MLRNAALAASLLATWTSAQQTRWGQCGGLDYEGPTRCPEQFHCTAGNRWYSQCVPMVSSAQDSDDDDDDNNDEGYVLDDPIQTESFVTVVTVTADQQPTVVTTYITFLTPSNPDPTDPPTIPDAPQEPIITLIPDDPFDFEKKARRNAAKRAEIKEEALAPRAATPRTLANGQLWIRAVTAPHFHDYLQTIPENTPNDAILGPHGTAGQYNIVSGQLVSATKTDAGESLYLHVEHPEDLTQRKLALWFNTTENPFGTFEFSGDAVTWSHPDVKRQNLAAFLACEGNGLFINTGAYAYQTPQGCSDHTVHFYNGATADG